MSTVNEEFVDEEFQGVMEELRKEKNQKNGKRRPDENDIDLSDVSTSGDDENENIDEEILTPSGDLAFIRTIQMLRSRDPRIFDKKTVIYDEKQASEQLPEEVKKAGEKRVIGLKKAFAETKKGQKITDIVREQILAQANNLTNENENSKDEDEEEREKAEMLAKAPATIERKALEAFEKKVEASKKKNGDTNNEEEKEDEEDLFVVKKKDTSITGRESADLVEAVKSEKVITNWLKDEISTALVEGGDEKEAFLKNYLASQAWVPKIEELREDDEDKSEDILNEDKQLYAQELYEDAYNHRNSEKGMDKILTFAAAMNSTIRKKKSKRAEQRTKKQEKLKLLEKQRKTELSTKKGEKRREIGRKIAILADAAGYTIDEFIKKYKDHPIMAELKRGDMKMDRLAEVIDDMFGDDYYNIKEQKMEDHDEVFNQMDDENLENPQQEVSMRQITELMGNNSDTDSSETSGEENNEKKDERKKNTDSESLSSSALSSSDSDDEDKKNEEKKESSKKSNMNNLMKQLNEYIADTDNTSDTDKSDDDEEESGYENSKEDKQEENENENEDNTESEQEKMRRIKEEKIKKTLDSAYNELNELEGGDYIEGLGRIKFKYISVPKDNFGLSEGDILTLSDKELNQVISMKQMAPYREKDPVPNYKYLRSLKKENKIKKIVNKNEFLERMEKMFTKEEEKIQKEERSKQAINNSGEKNKNPEDENKKVQEGKERKNATRVIKINEVTGKPFYRRDRGEIRPSKKQRDRAKKLKLEAVGGSTTRLKAYGSLAKTGFGDKKNSNNKLEKVAPRRQ